MAKPKLVPNATTVRALQEADRDSAIEKCAKCVPTNWTDELLTGKGAGPFADGRPIEALLRGVQDRIRALKTAQ